MSRSSLHACAPDGVRVAALRGGGGCGGGGGGNNGTYGGVPAGDAMDGGGDRAADAYVCSSGGGSSSDGPSSAAELAPKERPPFAPWLWFSAIWGLYVVWLKQSPLVTKAVTAGVLALGGDTAAQFFEFRQQAGGGRKCSFFEVKVRFIPVVWCRWTARESSSSL